MKNKKVKIATMMPGVYLFAKISSTFMCRGEMFFTHKLNSGLWRVTHYETGVYVVFAELTRKKAKQESIDKMIDEEKNLIDKLKNLYLKINKVEDL